MKKGFTMKPNNNITFIKQSQDYAKEPDSILRLDNLSAQEVLQIRREEQAEGNKVNIRTFGETTQIEIFWPKITVLGGAA